MVDLNRQILRTQIRHERTPSFSEHKSKIVHVIGDTKLKSLKQIRKNSPYLRSPYAFEPATQSEIQKGKSNQRKTQAVNSRKNNREEHYGSSNPKSCQMLEIGENVCLSEAHTKENASLLKSRADFQICQCTIILTPRPNTGSLTTVRAIAKFQAYYYACRPIRRVEELHPHLSQ